VNATTYSARRGRGKAPGTIPKRRTPLNLGERIGEAFAQVDGQITGLVIEFRRHRDIRREGLRAARGIEKLRRNLGIAIGPRPNPMFSRGFSARAAHALFERAVLGLVSGCELDLVLRTESALHALCGAVQYARCFNLWLETQTVRVRA
jgi:hypothetical protein